MQYKFPSISSEGFVPVNSYRRAIVLASLCAAAAALSFLIIPFYEWKLHFFQLGIFLAGFVFGPFSGALAGAASSAYNGLFILHNPYIIAGNALLGFFGAYFYTRHGALKAALLAFAIQAPYVWITDIYLVHMPQPAVIGILETLLATNIICAAVAGYFAPSVAKGA